MLAERRHRHRRLTVSTRGTSTVRAPAAAALTAPAQRHAVIDRLCMPLQQRLRQLPPCRWRVASEGDEGDSAAGWKVLCRAGGNAKAGKCRQGAAPGGVAAGAIDDGDHRHIGGAEDVDDPRHQGLHIDVVRNLRKPQLLHVIIVGTQDYPWVLFPVADWQVVKQWRCTFMLACAALIVFLFSKLAGRPVLLSGWRASLMPGSTAA